MKRLSKGIVLSVISALFACFALTTTASADEQDIMECIAQVAAECAGMKSTDPNLQTNSNAPDMEEIMACIMENAQNCM